MAKDDGTHDPAYVHPNAGLECVMPNPSQPISTSTPTSTHDSPLKGRKDFPTIPFNKKTFYEKGRMCTEDWCLYIDRQNDGRLLLGNGTHYSSSLKLKKFLPLSHNMDDDPIFITDADKSTVHVICDKDFLYCRVSVPCVKTYKGQKGQYHLLGDGKARYIQYYRERNE